MGRPAWIDALILVALVTLVFGSGWAVNGWRQEAHLAKVHQTYKDAEASASRAAVSRLASAQRRNDELAEQLATEENTRFAIVQEKDLEISRLTVGRRCLDAAAVRVLNRPAGNKPAAVPQASGQPLSADAPFATDTDVGQWINHAQAAYDTCRGHLAAIADFYAGETE